MGQYVSNTCHLHSGMSVHNFVAFLVASSHDTRANCPIPHIISAYFNPGPKVSVILGQQHGLRYESFLSWADFDVVAQCAEGYHGKAVVQKCHKGGAAGLLLDLWCQWPSSNFWFLSKGFWGDMNATDNLGWCLIHGVSLVWTHAYILYILQTFLAFCAGLRPTTCGSGSCPKDPQIRRCFQVMIPQFQRNLMTSMTLFISSGGLLRWGYPQAPSKK